jgi:hypothetical protein
MSKKLDSAAPQEQPTAEVQTKLTPVEYGRIVLGADGKPHVRDGRNTFFGSVPEPYRSPEYRAAETLHGWGVHHLHTADPLLITREAFDAALVAGHTADAQGNYTPHAPALAPHMQPKGDA